jgi:DNA invertase Pin-like site-specific DNA recombinase
MRVYGYARVSTAEQSLELQQEHIKDLCKQRGYDLVNIYSEKQSGGDLAKREQAQMMLDSLEKNSLQIDAIIIYKLDRLGRSLQDLINILQRLDKYKVQLISITEQLDTTTPAGRLYFHMASAFAEFERAIINERIKAGRQRAIGLGKKMGRPRKEINIEEVAKKLSLGVTIKRISKDLKISRSLLYREIKESKERALDKYAVKKPACALCGSIILTSKDLVQTTKGFVHRECLEARLFE